MLQGPQVFSARLSSLWISLLLEGYLLPFSQSMKARTFDCADVDKYVRPTVVRPNKAKAFLAVEKLHNTRCHFRLQCLRNRLLPTQHVSTFDPAVSWEGKALQARPSRQPDNSNVVTLSAFGKIDIRTSARQQARPDRLGGPQQGTRLRMRQDGGDGVPTCLIVAPCSGPSRRSLAAVEQDVGTARRLTLTALARGASARAGRDEGTTARHEQRNSAK
jgi:hypothetical protein